MDKLLGTISPVSTDKGITSVDVKVVVKSNAEFKVADIQFQEGQSFTQHNLKVSEQYTDEINGSHFNFLARGVTTLVVPYMSEVPFENGGVLLPGETEYITTPVKADLFIHKPFYKTSEELSVGPGLPGGSKRFELNENVEAYTNCVYNGYTSRKYIGGVENNNAFIGRELRLANADNKFTITQNNGRKTTGALYANKTRREV